jgi:CRISPR-associated protein Csb2
MPGLTIGWEYLTGYAVSTDPGDRDRAEWPPHPGRLFLALAAAWFETGEDKAEGDGLRWLETLGNPQLHLPPRDQVFERSPVTVYVPVNDKAGPAKMTLQCLPSLTRSKQPRTFPRVWVGDRPCFIHWPIADDIDKHRFALDRLCAKVTRMGHSSSLVRMWVADGTKIEGLTVEHWVAEEVSAECHLRSVSVGTLDMFVERYNAKDRERHAQLNERIDVLSAEINGLNSKGTKDRRTTVELEMETLVKKRDAINARPPLRPTLGLWTGYRRVDSSASGDGYARSHFDTDLLVLTHVDGPRLPLESTLVVTRALRDTVMSRGSVQPPPAWVSGHEADGSPLRGDDGHLACIPLPFVGGEHADGHLLGVGLVFPRIVERRERGRALGALLLDETGRPRRVELKMGRLGVWTIQKRDWTETRRSLQAEAWTGFPVGATTWASVTPVVLDRFPKADRATDRVEWTEEVCGIVAASCVRIGLPKPADIDVDTTCWHRGSSRAVGKRRSLRSQAAASQDADAALGDGFPPFPAKGTNGPRPQVHVWLRFSGPVIGPVLLGTGRYLGYGLCKPWMEDRR